MASTQLATKSKTDTFMESVKNRTQAFTKLLPSGMQADWFTAEVRVAIARAPKLMECDQISVFDAITTCAQLGLSPSGRLGSAYLIPFGGKCTLVVGYKGYLDLAYRSGEVVGMQAQVVHSEDTFDWEEGLTPMLKHKRSDADNPGPMTHAYAVAQMANGFRTFVVLTKREVEAIKAKAPGARQRGGPWDTDPGEMWKKTAIRRLVKLLPLSPSKAQALHRAQEVEDAVYEEADMLVREEEASTSGMDRLERTLEARPEPGSEG